MKSESRRFLLWSFIVKRIFKIPIGEKLDIFCIVLRFILMPLNTIKMSIISDFYDYSRDIFIIKGLKISSGFFEFFANQDNVGGLFRFVKQDNGVISIKRESEEKNKENNNGSE